MRVWFEREREREREREEGKKTFLVLAFGMLKILAFKTSHVACFLVFGKVSI